MNEEVFHVRLASGDVCVMDLDQLDDAFQKGHINEQTFVLPSGATQWTKLGDLAGIEDAPPAPPPRAAPLPYVSPSAQAAWPPPAAPSYPPSPVAHPSVRPVVADVSFDDFDVGPDPFKAAAAKKKKVVIAGIAAAVAVCGLVAALGSASGTADAATTAKVSANVAAAAPPPPAPPPPVVEPAPAPQDRLNDEQRRALLDADKARAAKNKARVVAAPRTTKPRASQKVFHKGGDKYDPLNSSL